MFFWRFLVLIICFAATPLWAQEPPVQRDWVFFAGYAVPFANQGLHTSFWEATYHPKFSPDQTQVWGALKTNQLLLNYQDGSFGLQSKTLVVNEGDSRALYDRGRHLNNLAFFSHSQTVNLSWNITGSKDNRLKVDAGGKTYLNQTSAETARGLELPTNFKETRVGLSLGNQEIEESLQVQGYYLQIDQFYRQGLKIWALEAAPSPKVFQIKGLGRLSPWQGGGLEMQAGWGEQPDFFTSFNLGSLTGNLPVPGYFRNEFRSQRFYRAKYRQSIEEDGIKYWADLTLAQAQIPDWQWESGGGRSQTLTGWALGVYYPIEALQGLPLILLYGQGVPPNDQMGQPRQEVLIALAAAL